VTNPDLLFNLSLLPTCQCMGSGEGNKPYDILTLSTHDAGCPSQPDSVASSAPVNSSLRVEKKAPPASASATASTSTSTSTSATASVGTKHEDKTQPDKKNQKRVTLTLKAENQNQNQVKARVAAVARAAT